MPTVVSVRFEPTKNLFRRLAEIFSLPHSHNPGGNKTQENITFGRFRNFFTLSKLIKIGLKMREKILQGLRRRPPRPPDTERGGPPQPRRAGSRAGQTERHTQRERHNNNNNTQ